MPQHPYKKWIAAIVVLFLLFLATGADADPYQETYPQHKESIQQLQYLSECRALMHYYADLLGIAYQVNREVIGAENNTKIQQDLKTAINELIDRALEIKDAQNSIGTELLHDLTQPVIVEIIAVSYVQGLHKISDLISGTADLGNVPARREFLQNYVKSSTKCANFLYGD
jgi:hypothetical protein